MLSPENAQDRLALALAHARRLGADAADALYVADASTGIGVRMGALEDIGRSEGEEVGLRIFVGNRSAQVSTSDLSPRALETAAERALATAREAPEDAFAGLAPVDRLAQPPFPDLDTFDPTLISADRLKTLALACEDAARAIPGVTNSEGASAAAGEAVMALATSHGFTGGRRGSSFSLSASVIAGEGAGMQRDYDWHSTRHFADLESPETIGTRAGTRAIARLAPIKLDSAAMPVVFDPRVAGSLLGHLIGAITGSAIARKTSFLLDAEGTQVFATNVRILDDPHWRRGLASRAFDGEGLPTAPTTIIENGILTSYLIDSASARQLGRAPTGHASRGISGPPSAGVTNLFLGAGSETPASLMADIKLGLYVTELIGMGVNGLTGDYSRGAGGFLIENGELTRPVNEVTIAGNLRAMFRALTPANDLTIRHAINAPTTRIDGMTLAGN
ncbi:TldD/PmbA family protein [Sandaracinobacteroides saxicola]|uniref:TldD/PmbA family protein n=1 Tax=Sandaracinobacteroides saxicola TaxID=2759707 RepID=A0A7G5ILT5_9SPHN|nr:metallopeptidase TldD-related protein [Sandaracinobacteroides saxicola]QMW24327.1 TldD/PmbA family protein [Sandaracinobacteroides saxicola]